MVAVAQEPDTSPAGGLFASLKNLAAILLAVAHTRLELFSTEAEEGWMRIAAILRWGLVAGFCAGLGILFTVLFFVVLLWDSHRLWAVGIPAVLFILAAAVASRIVSAKMGTKPRLFSASLAELAKDRERFTSR
jgi:uncharacterized membrane protein YqjE